MAFTLNDANLQALKTSAKAKWKDYFNRYTPDALARFMIEDTCQTETFSPFFITPVVAGKTFEEGNRQKQSRNSFATKKGFEKMEGSFKEQNDKLADDPGLVAAMANGGLAKVIGESYAKTLKGMTAAIFAENQSDFTGTALFHTAHKYLTTDTFSQSNIIAAESGDPKVPYWYVATGEPLFVKVERDPIHIEVVGQGTESSFEYDTLVWGWKQRLLIAPIFWGNIVRSNKPITEESVLEAIAVLEGFKNMTGTEDLGNVAKYLICSKTNRSAAEKLLKTQINAMGATNFMFNRVEPVVADSLSDVTV